MKFVGIDFGHGEVSASFFDGEQLKRLRLVLTTTENPNMYKIPSYLYKCEGEEKNSIYYSLEEHSPCSLISGMKKPISNMTDEEKGRYQTFIQLIYQRLLECNQELLADGAFELAIACPTKWDKEKKAEYKTFFERALGKSIYAIMNESDAAYFAKRTNDESGSSTLVVDYGSSTIDFTLVRDGSKVEEDMDGVRFDDWSSADLGASNIEDRIFDLYHYDKSISPTYNEISAAVMQILVSTKPDRSWIDYNAFIKKNIREFKEQIFTLRKEYFTSPIYYRPATHNGCDEPDESQSLEFEYVVKERILEIPGITTYIEAVKAHFKRVHGATGDVDKIILSGGAACMVWVSEALKDEFGQKTTIVLDSKPAYVVCDGIVKYCFERQKCLEEFLEEVGKIDIINIVKSSNEHAKERMRKSLIYDVIDEYAMQEYPRTTMDNLIDDILRKCFLTFNENNEDFTAKLNSAIKKNAVEQISERLNAIMEKMFHKRANAEEYEEAVKYLPEEVLIKLNYDKENETIEFIRDKIKDVVSSRYYTFGTGIIFNIVSYDKQRTPAERKEIAQKLKIDAMLKQFLDIEKELEPRLSNETKERLKIFIRTLACYIFDEMELFKTRFASQDSQINE